MSADSFEFKYPQMPKVNFFKKIAIKLGLTEAPKASIEEIADLNGGFTNPEKFLAFIENNTKTPIKELIKQSKANKYFHVVETDNGKFSLIGPKIEREIVGNNDNKIDLDYLLLKFRYKDGSVAISKSDNGLTKLKYKVDINDEITNSTIESSDKTIYFKTTLTPRSTKELKAMVKSNKNPKKTEPEIPIDKNRLLTTRSNLNRLTKKAYILEKELKDSNIF